MIFMRNLTEVRDSSLTNPKEVRADKRRINYEDRLSDELTVDKNMHECMVPDESLIGL